MKEDTLSVLIDPSRDRNILDLRSVGFQDVLVLGHYIYTHARSNLEMHDHGDFLEICYLVEGQQFYRINEDDYFLRGGDILINYPHERHGTGLHCEGRGNLYWIIMKPPGKRNDYIGLPNREGRILWESLLNLPGRRFQARKGSWKHLDGVFFLLKERNGICFGRSREDALLRINVNNLFLRFFLDLIESSETEKKPTPSEEIRRAIEAIKEDDGRFHTMKSLARVADLSESRFKHRFKEEVGITPADYQMRYKIFRACHFLRLPSETILHIALSMGFSSSQYFSTAFRRYMSMTPAEYRELTRQGEIEFPLDMILD